MHDLTLNEKNVLNKIIYKTSVDLLKNSNSEIPSILFWTHFNIQVKQACDEMALKQEKNNLRKYLKENNKLPFAEFNYVEKP